MFEVYSIGDAEMLYNAFQGVAMIFNTDDIGQLAGSGFVFGAFIVGARYLVNHQLQLQHLLAALVVYLVMFWPKVDVHLEDAYTAQVRTIAHVPIGVATSMSVVSTIGLRLTEMFESAFSVPSESSMLRNGYIDSLQVLLKMRGIGAGTADSDEAITGDVSRTLQNYIETCVMFDIDLPYGPHEVTRESLMKASSLWDAMRTTFINRDLLVVLPAYPDGQQMSCEAAYQAITTYLTGSQFGTLWENHLQGLMGIASASGNTATDRVANALAALSIPAADAQTYMRNALLKAYLQDGPAAYIERPAIEQLEIQWAGEQSMFKRVARPLMAFIETFTVATAPIAAFLVTMGPLGLTLAGRYLQLVAWVSLWGPVMAVCNMYVTVASGRAMAALAEHALANGSDIMSMGMMDKTFEQLEIWVGTGGMLAASTPALSMMLVYGGSAAASHLTTRFQAANAAAGEHKKALAPDPIQQAAPLQMAAQGALNPNTGLAMTGVPQPTLNFSSIADRSMTSALSGVQSASRGVSMAQSELLSSAQRNGHGVRENTNIADVLSHSNNRADQSAARIAHSLASSGSFTESERRAVENGAAGALGIGSPVLLKAGVESSLRASGVTDAGRIAQVSDQVQNAFDRNWSRSEEWQEARSRQQSHMDETFMGSESMKQSARNYQSQLQRMAQSQEQYSLAASARESAGKVESMDYNQASAKFVESGAHAAFSEMDRQILSSGDQALMADYQAARQLAVHEVDKSGAVLNGVQRDAMVTYLALDKVMPGAATKAAIDHILPTSPRIDAAIHPDTHKSLGRPVDEVWSAKEADAASRKSGMRDGDVDLGHPASASPMPSAAARSAQDGQAEHAGIHPSHRPPAISRTPPPAAGVAKAALSSDEWAEVSRLAHRAVDNLAGDSDANRRQLAGHGLDESVRRRNAASVMEETVKTFDKAGPGAIVGAGKAVFDAAIVEGIPNEARTLVEGYQAGVRATGEVMNGLADLSGKLKQASGDAAAARTGVVAPEPVKKDGPHISRDDLPPSPPD